LRRIRITAAYCRGRASEGLGKELAHLAGKQEGGCQCHDRDPGKLERPRDMPVRCMSLRSAPSRGTCCGRRGLREVRGSEGLGRHSKQARRIDDVPGAQPEAITTAPDHSANQYMRTAADLDIASPFEGRAALDHQAAGRNVVDGDIDPALARLHAAAQEDLEARLARPSRCGVAAWWRAVSRPSWRMSRALRRSRLRPRYHLPVIIAHHPVSAAACLTSAFTNGSA
jgi:hypothetical protein